MPNFQLHLTVLIFWKKFAQNRYFQSKGEKVNTLIVLWISQLVMVKSKLIFDIPVAKAYFSVSIYGADPMKCLIYLQ